MEKKNKTKQLPLYIQISELLNREIAAGHWLPGERLPIEAELAAKLGVAIGTLRKALKKL
ncbi:MAG: winged helix-turn-helix domain-containing protein, partial [Pseudomonadota bacterium]|nr:winged helix-turn-helix domain-containing protein [Pseudomonadota bacterium]